MIGDRLQNSLIGQIHKVSSHLPLPQATHQKKIIYMIPCFRYNVLHCGAFLFCSFPTLEDLSWQVGYLEKAQKIHSDISVHRLFHWIQPNVQQQPSSMTYQISFHIALAGIPNKLLHKDSVKDFFQCLFFASLDHTVCLETKACFLSLFESFAARSLVLHYYICSRTLNEKRSMIPFPAS